MIGAVGNNVEHFIRIVGNNEEKRSAWWATTWKSCHNAEQYNIFCELPYL
jgi:hypothetical protein